MYDFGNVIYITEEYKSAMRDFIYGVQSRDVNTMLASLLRMGVTVRDSKTTKLFIRKFMMYLESLDLDAFGFNSPEVRKMASQIPIELDPVTLEILKTYALLEGMCKDLNPLFSYKDIINTNIQLLLLDVDYILYRVSRDVKQLLDE
jgi:predicted unusual protein kinase regulating ubiquinone biosynthesis (AarF/ABC1/UbiB family)